MDPLRDDGSPVTEVDVAEPQRPGGGESPLSPGERRLNRESHAGRLGARGIR